MFDLQKYVLAQDEAARETGRTVTARCFCDGEYGKRKLYVYEDGKAYCFRHARLISALDAVRFYESCSFVEAVQHVKRVSDRSTWDDLRERLGQSDAAVAEFERQAVELPLPAEFVAYGAESRVPAYFAKRRITPQTARAYGMGYCKTGKYANRLVVPVSYAGKNYGFVARAMWPVTDKRERKYLNADGMLSSLVLFNLAQAARYAHLIIVEGVFDAVAVGPNAICTLGVSVSDRQLELLSLTGARTITVMYDSDAVAQAEIMK